MKKNQSNQLRIIGGSHKRSIVFFPDSKGLRPTPNRVRETLFNWLGQNLSGLVILDLFAGSGALGFEALSRGAQHVYLVDSDKKVVAVLKQNQQRLKFENLKIICSDALSFLKSDEGRFNVVFLDPPFIFNQWQTIFLALESHLIDNAYIYLEASSLPEIPETFHIIRNTQSGQSKQWLLQYQSVL